MLQDQEDASRISFRGGQRLSSTRTKPRKWFLFILVGEVFASCTLPFAVVVYSECEFVENVFRKSQVPAIGLVCCTGLNLEAVELYKLSFYAFALND